MIVVLTSQIWHRAYVILRIIVTEIYYVVSVRHSVKGFTCINMFNLLQNPMRWLYSVFPFYGKIGLGKVRNFFKTLLEVAAPGSALGLPDSVVFPL